MKLDSIVEIQVVVKDLDKVVAFYSTALSMGPFQVTKETEMQGAIHRGKPTTFRIKSASAPIAPGLQIRFIQITSGDSIHTEVLRQKGEGLAFLVSHVKDLDGSLKELAEHGIKPIFSHKVPGVISFAHLDTDKIGGVIIELMQWFGQSR